MTKDLVSVWPNNAKVAVMVTVLYESWSEGVVPVHSPMALASPLIEGTLDLQGVSWSEYGGETGVWRIAEMLDAFGVKATFCTNAQVVERYPASIAAIDTGGHEIAAHSYTQDVLLPYLSAEEELAVIRRCTDIIGNAIGKRPTGWISPRATHTPRTAAYLAEFGYRWHGDYNDTDLPYVFDTPKGPLVALMHSDFTDIRVIRGSPREFLEVHVDTFDYLHQSSRPEIINLSIHTHFGGRPLIASMLHKIFEHFLSFDDVWFARHDEVAEWVFKQRRSTATTRVAETAELAR